MIKEFEGFFCGFIMLKYKLFLVLDVEVIWDFVGRISSSIGGLYLLDEFDVGDVVWVKFGKKNDFVWFVKVVDLIKEVFDIV